MEEQPASERIEALERLSKLLDDGRISADEYESLKRRVLEESAQTSESDPPPPETGNELPVDAHQIAIDAGSAINPDEIGWYPDPVQPETHARFYDGDNFVGLPRKRRKPGWYPDSSVVTAGPSPKSFQPWLHRSSISRTKRGRFWTKHSDSRRDIL